MSSISMPDTSVIASEATVLLEATKTMVVITNHDEYERANHIGQGIKRLIKEVKETFALPKKLSDEAHKAICGAEKKHLNPLLEDEAKLKRLVTNYQEEQERKRRAEQRRLEEDARKKAEEERAAEAKAAEDFFGKEAAENVMQAPIVVPTVQAPRAVPKVEGVSSRENWKAEVFDLKMLVAAVAAGTVPIAAIQANETFLNGQARALKAEFSYPGVRAKSEKSVSWAS